MQDTLCVCVLPNDGCYHYSAGKSTRAMVVVEKAIFPPFQKALQFSNHLIILHANDEVHAKLSVPKQVTTY